MLWIELGAATLGGLAILVIVIAKRPVRDLGTISAQWIAEHRIDEA